MSGSNDLAILRRLLRHARPYWVAILGIFLLDLLATPLALLTPLPLKIAIDCVVDSVPFPGFLEALVPASVLESSASVLVVAAGLLVAVAVLSRLQVLSSWVLRAYTSERLLLRFRARLFQHLQRLSLAYHDTKGTADSLYRLERDAPAIQYIAIDGLIPFVTSGITIAAMLYVCFRVDWQLAGVALLVSPVLVILIQTYRRQMRHGWREAKQLESRAFSVLQEVLSAVRVVKAFGQENRERDRFVRRSNKGVRARVRLAAAEGAYGLLIGIAIASGTALVLFLGGRHVQAGTLSPGELLLLMGYLAQLYGPLKTISRKIGGLQSHLASAERALAVLDEPTDVGELPTARPLSRASGAVDFRAVGFTYPEGASVLHDVSFEIPAGSRVGITGGTGAGKSTLMSLLTRFYDPTEGAVLLDGVDLRDYRLVDLRSQFAIVLQEPVLFSTTIGENIAYARPGASVEQIVAAAKAANAHQFIVALPDGYDTKVGDRGMRLSGGERQRISLARAFLRDAPILILDEPTSAVDHKTEAEIIEAMDRLAEGRTTFLITHRRSPLRKCNLHMVLENGRLAALHDRELSAGAESTLEVVVASQEDKAPV